VILFWDAAQHIEVRPSWDCIACEKPWPCDPAREALAAELQPTALRIHMWLRLEVAAGDLPTTPAGELFERFLGWAG
jgi:hypothetical protein